MYEADRLHSSHFVVLNVTRSLEDMGHEEDVADIKLIRRQAGH